MPASAQLVNAVRDASVADFVHAVGLLVRRVRAVSAAHELSWSEAAVMGRLDRDGPATTADLARAEAVRPQSMGATIAALEERGLVARKPHRTDGRQVNIVLTAKGTAVRKSSKDAKLIVACASHRRARRQGPGDSVRRRRDHPTPGGKMTASEGIQAQPLTLWLHIHRPARARCDAQSNQFHHAVDGAGADRGELPRRSRARPAG